MILILLHKYHISDIFNYFITNNEFTNSFHKKLFSTTKVAKKNLIADIVVKNLLILPFCDIMLMKNMAMIDLFFVMLLIAKKLFPGTFTFLKKPILFANVSVYVFSHFTWKYHKQIVHEKTRQFCCEQCGKIYPTKFKLNNHVKIVHLKVNKHKNI